MKDSLRSSVILFLVLMLSYEHLHAQCSNTPDAISGPSTVCPGMTDVEYSIPPMAGASHYSWVFNAPNPGAQWTPYSNTTNIKLSFSNSFSSCTIAVYAIFSCGPSQLRTMTITAGGVMPGTPGAITGSPSAMPGQTRPFSVGSVANATSYEWSLPPGASIASGAGTRSITVSFSSSFTGGDFKVRGMTSSCAGNYSPVLSVSPVPAAPGSINFSPSICLSGSDVIITVSVAPVENARPDGTGYEWNFGSAAPVSDTRLNSVNIKFPANMSGNSNTITVRVWNQYGPSAVSSLTIPIYRPPQTLGEIQGSPLICEGAQGVQFSVTPVSGATHYTWWAYPAGTTLSGQGSAATTLSFLPNFTSCVLNVRAYDGPCAGPQKTLSLSVIPPPGSAGTITGNVSFCSGTVQSYSIAPVAHATGYVWSIPPGATITAGQNTSSIAVSFSESASPGIVSVYATNCSGNGAASSLPVDVITAGKVNENRSSFGVDHVTGTVNVDIPLFSVSEGDVSVSGVLNYIGNGVRVTSDEGYTGQNWNLSMYTWMVSREVRGLPDDYYGSGSDLRRGWLNNGALPDIIKDKEVFDTDNDPSTCEDEYANHSFLNSIIHTVDTEPDVFHVSAPGLSFDFYYDENAIPRVVPYQSVQIITPSTANITSFTVRDDRGFGYEFAALETVTETLAEPNDYFLVRKSRQYEKPITYTTGWRLTRITGPNYGTVEFTYRDVNTSNDDFYPAYIRKLHAYKYQYPIKFEDMNEAEKGSLDFGRNSTIKVPVEIVTNTHRVEFSSAPRDASTSLERLNWIRIYDRRVDPETFSHEFIFTYDYSQRGLLTAITEQTYCLKQQYVMWYYGGSIPPYDAEDKDDFDFIHDNSGEYTYSERLPSGSLYRLIYPGKGYTAFFYEPHEFFNGTNAVQAGGMRARKIITYNGTGGSDFVQEFEYKREDGVTSGRLQGIGSSKFGVAVLKNSPTTHKYRRTVSDPVSRAEQFTIEASEDLTLPDLLHGSAVGYERVVVKTATAGYSVYEYELPASYGDVSANSNEWQASRSYIARPSTETSACYEHPDIDISDGLHHYPFPPNPNYDFARGLLKKITDYYVGGAKVREKTFSYQRVYAPGLSSIRKLYGLSLEELPTYYYDGSYHDAKMFLYSRYEIFTDVKTVLSSETEILYHTPDLARKTESTVNYYYESPDHSELTRVTRQNSDGTQSVSRYKYAADYSVSPSGNTESAALHALKSDGRNALVEVINSVIADGTEKYTGAQLSTFKSGGSGRVLPYRKYSFNAAAGTASFVPTSSDGTNFIFDQANNVLDQTILSVDGFGNPQEIVGRDRQVRSVVYGYAGTLPLMEISGAKLVETKCSDFETNSTIELSMSFTPEYGPGRSGARSIKLYAGSSTSNTLYPSLAVQRNELTSAITFSVWVNAASSGAITLQFRDSQSSATITTTTVPFEGTGTWKYYTVNVDASGFPANFNFSMWTSATALIDDIILRPAHADVLTHTYKIPFGKTSDTDSRGVSVFYHNDPWGRLKAVYDHDRNVIKKYDYITRP